ncbi:MAG: hypothetical protein ACHQII_07640 [Bacteroidia bacterium]
MKTKSFNKQVNPSLLSFTERRLVNYLVGKSTVGKRGICFIGKKKTSKRYLAVKALQQKGIIEILKEKNNVATFCFTKLHRNQSKLSIINY